MAEFILNNFSLLFLIFLPLFSVDTLFFVPSTKLKLIKQVRLSALFFVSFSSIFLWFFFGCSSTRFQFVYDIIWVSSSNLTFSLRGIDGISIFFVLLTTLLIPVCLLASWSISIKLYKEYVIAFLVMEFF
jgi:NADH-quinone oxidoreductase subunit M